ncbi:hypothetical protein FOZ63_014613, partial [Perkinsus olseni]
MPRDTLNLVTDITAVRRRVSTLPYAGDEMAREIMELLGRRRPVGLSHAVGARCHQCCATSWWSHHVSASKRFTLDTVRKRCYRLGDHHEILEKDEHSGWVVLDGTLSDPSVSLWSEITYHRDKLYLRDIRYADYQFHPRDLSVWEVDPVTCERVLEIKTESEVTCFDVFSRDENLLVAYISPIHPAELRVDYHSLSRADCSKRRLMDDYIARCFHVPMFTEALGITLVDVALDGLGEMLSTVKLDCNPGDFISSIELNVPQADLCIRPLEFVRSRKIFFDIREFMLQFLINLQLWEGQFYATRSFNLVVDLLAIHTKFQGIRHIPHSCLKATLEFMGQRQPADLRRHDHARCRECCRGSWWHEHVNCRREAALDTVLHISYELTDSWQVVENDNGKFKQTGVSLTDLPGDPSNEIECRGGRIYGAAMTKDAPSSFDVCPFGPHDCRIAYSDNFKPWQ